MSTEMEKRIYYIVATVVILTVCVNVLVLAWTSKISDDTYRLNQAWHLDAEQALAKSQLLTQLEQYFGYNGLIHHFKNYVLRREEHYFDRAQIEIIELRSALKTFEQQSHLNLSEKHAVQVIKATLEQYVEMLHFAAEPTSRALPPSALDALIKIDDEPAEKAFAVLRQNISLAFIEAQYDQKRFLKVIVSRAQTGGWLIVPLLSFAALFNLGALWVTVRLLRERKALFNATPDAIIYFDLLGQVKQVNQAACALFGYSHNDFRRLRVESLFPDHAHAAPHNIREVFSDIEKFPAFKRQHRDLFATNCDGASVPVELALAHTHVGSHQMTVAVIHDLRKEKYLESQAQHDHLTGAFNRRYLDQILTEEIERAKRYGRQISVMLVDLDHFKSLNDTHGHLQGDKQLVQLYEFLEANLRPSDLVARWGGDEFLIICPETNPQSAIYLAQRLVHEYKSIQHFGLTLSIGVSGVDIMTELVSGKGLVENADKALYVSKERGRNQANLFQNHPSRGIAS
ncbi:hypothetical protein PALB_34040 [Pseudoalteromonas luteoviolacea B = ATCC 29581]|nr:hypothetical protein PALB_34040 [Pseudoalteromonas luteoviolacea B = ATCC 29581]